MFAVAQGSQSLRDSNHDGVMLNDDSQLKSTAGNIHFNSRPVHGPVIKIYIKTPLLGFALDSKASALALNGVKRICF